MFGHILLAAAAAAATPSPSPYPLPNLKTIATVHVSARCAAIVTHANGAIASALDDNETISQTITQLRITNLDDGIPMHRYQGLNALRDLASQLYKQSHSGESEIKQLRDLEAKTADPQERKELKSFADALGGAIGRQLKMARDLDGFLSYIDDLDMQGFGGGSAMDDNVFAPDPYAPAAARSKNSATAYAHNAADDFQTRLPALFSDENQAATHVEGALDGC